MAEMPNIIDDEESSPIQPVSSLRSRFEQLNTPPTKSYSNTNTKNGAPPPPAPKPASLQSSAKSQGRPSAPPPRPTKKKPSIASHNESRSPVVDPSTAHVPSVSTKVQNTLRNPTISSANEHMTSSSSSTPGDQRSSHVAESGSLQPKSWNKNKLTPANSSPNAASHIPTSLTDHDVDSDAYSQSNVGSSRGVSPKPPPPAARRSKAASKSSNLIVPVPGSDDKASPRQPSEGDEKTKIMPIKNRTKARSPSASRAPPDTERSSHDSTSVYRRLSGSSPSLPLRSDDQQISRPRKLSDAESNRPALPPRNPVIEASSTLHTAASPGDLHNTTATRRSALSQGFSSSGSARSRPVAAAESRAPEMPPRRETGNATNSRPALGYPQQEQRSHANSDPIRRTDRNSRAIYDQNVLDFPDSFHANRQLPRFADGPRMIATTYDTRLVDVYGEYVCTTGQVTRVWNIVTGKLLMSLNHPEGVRSTALAFKPASKVDEDGQYLWIGTNWGEIQEINIRSKKVSSSNASTHHRREILRILRKSTELWTIDDEGKVFVWPVSKSGSSNINKGVFNGHVPRGCTAAAIDGDALWLGFSKDVMVIHPSAEPSKADLEISRQIIASPNAGSISCCAIIPGAHDLVYFGHTNGAISLFSRKTLEHLETLSIHTNKITCIIGVCDHLWVGFSSGMILMYDTTTRPWTTKKQWAAHNNPVVALGVDFNSIWKLGRLQVVSLGSDNMIGVWDGLTEDYWINEAVRKQESQYSEFQEVTALVVTWNAGASKPEDLRYDQHDANFFRDIIAQSNSPDIIVFGLQELVDLEDKKLTAKSFFKGRSKDAYGQEQLSSVYRAWRDYLTRCLDDAIAPLDSYTLLHSASLVGLFTCVFVKTSLRARTREIQASEVKTGLGGLHGNKGALIVRFIIDDTTVCFVNCHLAAGQGHTANRNHDVEAILEYPSLTSGRQSDQQAGLYALGGDGSMVMDHAVCILNGDLNYRIDSMARDTIIKALRDDNLGKLLENDQLRKSRKKNPGFRLRDFIEAPIEFQPTYKYDVRSDNYDTSEKRRAPAWCDRILYRSNETVEQTSYKRHEVRMSDHRPVSGTFRVRLQTVDGEKREQSLATSRKQAAERRERLLNEIKLDHLCKTFGMSAQEARDALQHDG